MIGKCTKCQTLGKVIMHHTKGYEGENKDFVLSYCRSCHAKIHLEARKSGRCQIPVKELAEMSIKSVNRRKMKQDTKYIYLIERLIEYVELYERIHIWKNSIYFISSFRATNGKKLKYIDIY